MKTTLSTLAEHTLSKNSTYESIINYAGFLVQLLKLWMFIPCGENGKPLEEPKESNNKYYSTDTTKHFDRVKFNYDLKEYQKAQERVLFEGFELDYSTPKFMRIKGKTEFDNLLFETKTKTFYDYWDKELESIQDLSGKVELVEWKLKELNL